MTVPAFTLCFIERKEADTPSIESVFRCIADELRPSGVKVIFQKLPFGNSFSGVFWNLLRFRPLPADIYHIAGHIHYIGLKLPSERTVLTVHDLGILRQRTGLRRKLIEWFFFKLPGRRLKYLTAVSEFTKSEFSSLKGIKPEKIRVIKNPLLPGLTRKQREFNENKPVILQVGTAPNKNLYGLIKASAPLQCKLRIIGEISARDMECLAGSGIEYENLSRAARPELAQAYLESDMLAFCSTYEGFGLPVIEAQAVGLPVITSDLAPMRDVAGDAAVLVDPDNPESIRKGIEKVRGNRSLRESLVEAGFNNAAGFAPSKIAGEYAALYLNILETMGKITSHNDVLQGGIAD